MLKNIRNEKSMQVDQLAQYIGFDTTPASWKIAYKEIKNNIPQNIKWLDKKYALSVLKYYKLNDMSFIKKYLETIEMINSNFYLRQICYLWHYILYIDNSDLYKDVWNWKRSENLFKNAGSDMMPVVVLLSGYEKHLQNMKKRKYDNEQIEEQIRNINECCTLDKKIFNIDGIRFSQMVWGSYFINGKLIQVGRLQYEIVEKVPTEVRKFKDGNYIYIHIPRGKNLNIEEVEKSIKLSKEKILHIGLGVLKD